MSQYDQLSEDFCQKGGFTYEADIRAILNGLSFTNHVADEDFELLRRGRIPVWLAKMLLKSQSCWS